MASDSASLLTKTQRRRVADGFDDLDDDATSRDERRIRERLAAGLGDMSRLADYPDEQLSLAVADVDEDELIATLADGRVLLDRVAEVRGIEHGRVVSRASKRATVAAESPTDTASLARLTFETEREHRERFERERGPDRWDRRANRLLRVAAWLFLPSLLMWLPDTLLGTSTMSYTLVWALPALLGTPIAFVELSVRFLQSLKHDILPALRRLLRSPASVAEAVGERLSRPFRTLRRVWDDL